MWTSAILQHICAQMKCYRNKRGKPKVTISDLRKYFGHVLILAVLGLRRNEDLWREKGIIIDYPGKPWKLGWKKWQFINSHLLFDHKFVHQQLRQNFQKHMQPGRNMCVDEARIPCQNESCPVRSYNPSKPAKWAIESLTLSDSTRYLWDFTNPMEDDAPTPFQWLIICGERLRATGRTHRLTADKRFSNLEQALALKTLGVESTLCCKPNSPSWLFANSLSQDLRQWRVHLAEGDGAIAACYHQKKKLCLVTTAFKVEEKEGATRDDRLPVLQHYDDTKRWTDQFDQLASNFHYHHSHSDWKATLLLGWFGWAHTNAYILFNLVTNSDSSDHYGFLMECAEALIKA
jgi:hypothetical protein